MSWRVCRSHLLEAWWYRGIFGGIPGDVSNGSHLSVRECGCGAGKGEGPLEALKIRNVSQHLKTETFYRFCLGSEIVEPRVRVGASRMKGGLAVV